MFGIAPSKVQDLVLGFVDIHEVCTGPPLMPVKGLLDGFPCFQQVDCTTQFGIIGILAEGTLDPTVQSMSVRKILKSTCPTTESQGIPLITHLHLDTEPLTTELCT